MPPTGKNNGPSSSSSKRKNDVSEKVREIQQRQQNWLVQREQSKAKEGSSINAKNKSSPSHQNKPVAGRSSSGKLVMTLSHQPTIASSKQMKSDQGKKKVTDTFNNWRKARERNLLDEENDAISIRSGAESELERLVSPDIDTLKAPVAENEFGTLADKIASRVKENLGISEIYANDEFESSETSVSSVSEILSQDLISPSYRCKTYTQKDPAFNHSGDSLTSHHCSECQILMFSSTHIPMMIIPCGHTLCKACSNRMTHCPECNCSVISFTVNIMLQQVIQEYHSQMHRISSSAVQRKGTKLNHQNTVGNISRQEGNQRIKPETYQLQLTNLQTRQSVLKEEHDHLVNKHSKLTSHIQQISSQTKSIIEQEHEVKKAIVDLKDRLSALEAHREQYESQLTELHDDKSETEGKITLLSETLSSLTRELYKVKLLAEGEQLVS